MDIFQQTKRSIGWIGITAISLGAANVAIVVLGTLLTAQGTSSIPLLVFGLAIACFAMPGYLELVLMYPNKVGGICAVLLDAFRPYNPILANIAGTCYWLAWAVGGSVTVIFAATTLNMIIPWISIYWLGTALVIAVMVINLCGLSLTMRLAIPIAFIAGLLTLMSILIPVLTGHINWSQATHYDLKLPFRGFFGELTSIMSGLYLVSWIAPNFENCLCYVGETKNPQKNVPRALYATAALAILYTAICPIIWLGVLGPENLMKDLLGEELARAYMPLLGYYSTAFSHSFLFFNTVILMFATIASSPRTLGQLAEDGLVPRFLGLKSQRDVYWVATVITSAILIICIWNSTQLWVYAALNFCYLLCITLASTAVWLLRKDAPDAPRLFRAPNIFIELGMITAFLWLISTIFGFQQYGLSAMMIGILLSFTGAPLYVWRKLMDRWEQGLPLFPPTLHIKLTGTILIVLTFDVIGYLIAVYTITDVNSQLIVLLEDTFVVVALLTLSIGLILPGIIIYGAEQINHAANYLIEGTLTDFSRAMQALAEGNLDAAYAGKEIYPISLKSEDEIGSMAVSFNKMQEKISQSARSLDGAREGLRKVRNDLIDSNFTLHRLNELLEEKVEARTITLETVNNQLKNEISERIKAERQTEVLHNQLVIASRSAGMADIAASVLHNAGNVLNSINVTVDILNEKITHSKMSNLTKISDLLKKHKEDISQFLAKDGEGKDVLHYISVLAEILSEEKNIYQSEIQGLKKHIELIKNIITTQQSIADKITLIEQTSIPDLINDALTLNRSIIDSSIEIIREFEPIKTVIIDKGKLLQILVNVIKNALESLIESKKNMKKLIICVKKHDENNFDIQIIDNGIGIASPDIKNIFSFGFTTKKTGHGFGLHTSANDAVDMGGRIFVESQGREKGATFTIVLPYHQPEKKKKEKTESIVGPA